MDPRLDQALTAIETACAALEAALRAEDWQAADVGDQELNAGLERFGALLDDSALHGDGNLLIAGDPQSAARVALELAATRLARVLEHHGRLAERLTGVRDAAGDELTELRRGRRGATHYLETAGT